MNDAPGAAVSLPLWRVDRILYDEGGLLVVDKPIGMPVHGGDESLAHSVVERLKVWLSTSGREEYLGVHQRLDQETSGLLLFVTDEKKNAEVAAAVEERRLRRTYWAVVAPARTRDLRSEPEKPQLPENGTVEVSLHFDGERSWVSPPAGARSPKGPRGPRAQHSRPAPPARGKSKRAVTRFRIVRRQGDRALVRLELETGRTHQIRATMAHLGFPVVGDHLYGGQSAFRMMLHAVELSGGPLPRPLKSPVPGCFESALQQLDPGLPEKFETAILDAATLRAPLLQKTNTFRLINGLGDELSGMTVDVYGEFLALNFYDPAVADQRERIVHTLTSLGYRGVYEKQRIKADLRAQDADALAPKQASAGETAPELLIVQENGMKIEVDLTDGLSTGLFLDMRDNRARVRGWAGGAKVLNLFCYTSSFGVAAALGGATTTNVDLSAKALARSRRNFEINDLDPGGHRFFKEDAMKFLARSTRRGDRYHLIVLDPPSFATVGKGTFSVKNLYETAAADCFRLLESDGRLLCVTNHTKTTPRAFRATVEAAALAAGKKLRFVKVLASGLDCPGDARGPWPSKSLLAQVEG